MRLISRPLSSFLSILTSVSIAAPANQPAPSKRSIATKTCPISGSITSRSTPIIITDSLPADLAASRFQTSAYQLRAQATRNTRKKIEDRGSRIEDRGSRIEDRGSRIEERNGFFAIFYSLSSILDLLSRVPRFQLFQMS